MYLEAKETALLYKLLTDKLGNDTTEAMFKYIDNKTERSVEATIKTLATKDDLLNLRKDLGGDIVNLRKDMVNDNANLKNDIANVRYDLSIRIGNSVKWMFIFWMGQVGATIAILLLFLKK
ncbi:MAG TPA: hypothetical protein VIJ27_06265 [Mucilaginibacter sp.]